MIFITMIVAIMCISTLIIKIITNIFSGHMQPIQRHLGVGEMAETVSSINLLWFFLLFIIMLSTTVHYDWWIINDRNVDDFLRKGCDDDLVLKKDIIEKFQCEKDLQLHDQCSWGQNSENLKHFEPDSCFHSIFESVFSYASSSTLHPVSRWVGDIFGPA